MSTIANNFSVTNKPSDQDNSTQSKNVTPATTLTSKSSTSPLTKSDLINPIVSGLNANNLTTSVCSAEENHTIAVQHPSQAIQTLASSANAASETQPNELASPSESEKQIQKIEKNNELKIESNENDTKDLNENDKETQSNDSSQSENINNNKQRKSKRNNDKQLKQQTQQNTDDNDDDDDEDDEKTLKNGAKNEEDDEEDEDEEEEDEEEGYRCLCGSDEDEGLAVQCDECRHWQHGHCLGFLRESDVPARLVCNFCAAPTPPSPRQLLAAQLEAAKAAKSREVRDLLHTQLQPITTPRGRLSREERKLQEEMKRFEELEKREARRRKRKVSQSSSPSLTPEKATPSTKSRSKASKKRTETASSSDAVEPPKKRQSNEGLGLHATTPLTTATNATTTSNTTSAATASSAKRKVSNTNNNNKTVSSGTSRATPSKPTSNVNSTPVQPRSKAYVRAAFKATSTPSPPSQPVATPLSKKKAWIAAAVRDSIDNQL